jgi:tRNA (cmo5U34)-methyltransferase
MTFYIQQAMFCFKSDYSGRIMDTDTILKELARADRYDVLVTQCLPYWDVFFGTVAAYLPAGPISILELGSGTGMLTSIMRSVHPNADITCLDRSPEMLNMAKQKPELEGVRFVEQDIRETWPGVSYDMIVSTQCLFALNREEQEELLGRARASLNNGGRFIVGDGFRPENSWEEGIYRAHWKHFMVENGFSPAEADAMISSRDTVYDNISTLEEFRGMLQRAGFGRLLTPYWYEMYAIVVAFI